MAFCPNCGTPNTEQANKCVNCGNALTPAAGGGKFKGTIMMGTAGSQGLPQPPPPAAAPAPPPAAAPARPDADLAFQKTMVGPGAAAPVPAAQSAPAPAPASPEPPPAQEPSSFSQPAPMSFQDEPSLPTSNATKTMAMVLGASVLVAGLIIAAALLLR